MPRPLRLEFADALYHVTPRGDRREDIYHDVAGAPWLLQAQANPQLALMADLNSHSSQQPAL